MSQPYINFWSAWVFMDQAKMEAAICDAQDDLFDAIEMWHAMVEMSA